MSESKKGELAIRDKALQHQQRRLKQATQFTHKDSADLLPLDSLKRMGTSKDLQPHNIVQRRLLEGNVTRLRGGGDQATRGGLNNATSQRCIIPSSPLLLADSSSKDEERSESTPDDSTTEEGGSAEEEEEGSPEESSERSLRSDEEEEEDSEAAAGPGRTSGKTEVRPRPPLTTLLVQCKCFETDIKAAINTGSQHNHISNSCCRRLGLVPVQDSAPCGLVNTVRGLQLHVGRQSVQCSAVVTEDEVFELCLGLHTLLELKCCVDLSARMLKLQGSGEELPFLETTSDSRCHHHHDTNENLGRAPLPSPPAL